MSLSASAQTPALDTQAHAMPNLGPDTGTGGSAPTSTAVLGDLSRVAANTGRHIVELAGELTTIDEHASDQLVAAEQMARDVDSLINTAQAMNEGLGTVAGANDHALSCVLSSMQTLHESAKDSRSIAGWVGHLVDALQTIDRTLTEVTKANARITQIAKQVNILAVNARVEAARAGDMGRGFGVVAEAINTLSSETGSASDAVTASTRTLQGLIKGLRENADDVSGQARAVLGNAETADSALGQIRDNVSQAADATQGLGGLAQSVKTTSEAFAPAINALSKALGDTAKGVKHAHERAESIVDNSEHLVQKTVELGGVTEEAHLIELVQDSAARIGALFDQAIARGEISQNALFDMRYTPIAGTDPEQVMAPFTELCDRVVPGVIEPILASDSQITFCAPVDRNGYLPTHNRKFSAPQGDDPVWNAANSRNRRIFNDRVGLKAGRNTAPFLMQTYRRDMGGGEFVLMKDLSSPILVGGRHWGGLRLAFFPKP